MRFQLFIDTHTHLNFGPVEPSTLIEKARAANVPLLVAIGAGKGLIGNLETVALAEQFPLVYATVGVHPHDADQFTLETVAQLKALAGSPKIVAIGEIGLDFHYLHSSRENQVQAFEQQLTLAKALGKPVVIHSREAEAETLAILKRLYDPVLGGIIHCFTGSADMARTVLDMGFYLAVNGILTFRDSTSLRAIIKEVPVDRLVLETDAPYLAPVPFRGKSNESAYIPYIANALAVLKGLELAEVERVTSENAQRVFQL